jgi:galacturonokinase
MGSGPIFSMNQLTQKFAELFGAQPVGQIRSPLRICPLGAHVDHQGGLVTGMALDVNVDLLYSPDEAGFVRVQSVDFPDEEYFHIDRVPEMLPGFWGNYIRGSVLSLARDFKLRKGFKAVIRGRLPMGGLSSSAAVTTAYLMALADVNALELGKEALIQYSHWVETAFIGLKNGILDQSSNILSRDGFLMKMDCQSNEWGSLTVTDYKNLGVRAPDYYLDSVGKTLGEAMGNIIAKSYEVIQKEKPDALLVLGDTNSALSAISA